MRPRALLAVFVLLGPLAFLAPGISAQQGPPQPPPAGVSRFGDSPGRWVPFSATTKRIWNPGRVVVGRMYRASDGSLRNETGPSLDRIDVIAINSVADRVLYLWRPDSGWESRPLGLLDGKYLQPSPATLQGITVDEWLDGLGVIELPGDSSGVTKYQAPELNYFVVKMLMPCNDGSHAGCGLWLSDIRIGEQPPELFVPGEPPVH